MATLLGAGAGEMESAKLRLASAKKWVSSSTKTRTMAGATLEAAKQDERDALQEWAKAEAHYKAVERKWEVCEVDSESDGEGVERNVTKKHRVSFSPAQKIAEDGARKKAKSIASGNVERTSMSYIETEIEILEKTAAMEFDCLTDKIRENSGLFSANDMVVRVTEDDPIIPLQVVKDNVRQKYETAKRDVGRLQKSMIDLQCKVAVTNALLDHHRGKLAQLKLRANQFDQDDGPVQKVARVVNALVRELHDIVNDIHINANTPPAGILKFLSNQINELGSILKDDHVCKVVKRIKRMGKEACPCCSRSFDNMNEYKTFTNRMSDLQNVDTSELIQINQSKSKEQANLLAKLERCRHTISDNINAHNEYTRINAEIQNLEALIAVEEDAEIIGLKAALEREQASVEVKKVKSEVLLNLLNKVDTMVDTAERFWEMKCQVKDKKDGLKRK